MKQNLTKIKVAFFFAATLLLASCGKYEKTPSGLAYKITKGKGKTTIKNGEIIQFNIEYKVGKKDSILFTTFGKAAQFIPVDFAKLQKHDFTEILPKLSLGDKAEFVMNIDTLVKTKMLENYNNIFTKGGFLKGRIEIVKIYPNRDSARADMDIAAAKAQEIQMVEREKQMKEMSAKQEKELKEYVSKNKAVLDNQIKELKDYAIKNNIKVVQSPLGVLVEVANEGTGIKGENGKHVQLMYRGYLMNGKVFDANLGIDAKHKEPLPVAVGLHNTIPGFEDAMKFFGKGGKGRLLIPAVLAYRDQANQEIPANSNLIFDIEVVDVLNEAPKPQMHNP